MRRKRNIVRGAQIVIFYSLNSLINNFESEADVMMALGDLRNQARDMGSGQLKIGICIAPSFRAIDLAKKCGFDFLTGYNYHNSGFDGGKDVYPIAKLTRGSVSTWNKFLSANLPYVASVTLNWDPRPWSSGTNIYSKSPRYYGFSSLSTYSAVMEARVWLRDNSKATFEPKIAFLYAWNEYGEGAYLTPSKDGLKPLIGGKRALNQRL